ncbi:MAG: hypothetical protein JSW40_05025, partial [Candidatus Omnitrophota bacterium]
ALNDTIYVGSPAIIRFERTSTTTVNDVKIEYSVDGGSYQTVQVGSESVTLQPSDGTVIDYTWNNVQNAISTNVLVKVTDNGNPNVSDISGQFAIGGGLTLNYPATGDKWPITPKTKLIDFDTTG